MERTSYIELSNANGGSFVYGDEVNTDGSMTFPITDNVISGVFNLYFHNNIVGFPKVDTGIQITVELPPSNHPSLSATEATIYSESNATFGKQILIKFNGNISGANITKIVADNGNIVIENFILNATSILTGQLSDSAYDTIFTRLGDGHVVIEENGQEYILPFAFVRG